MLATVHLVAALAIYAQNYEGNWGYYPFALIDFPIMLLLVLINKLVGISAWGPIFVLGTIWWYFLGLWISRAFVHDDGSGSH